jgi:hypothetical protein
MVIHTIDKCILYKDYYVVEKTWNAIKIPFIFSSDVHSDITLSEIADMKHLRVLVSLGENRNHKSMHTVFEECRKQEMQNL